MMFPDALKRHVDAVAETLSVLGVPMSRRRGHVVFEWPGGSAVITFDVCTAKVAFCEGVPDEIPFTSRKIRVYATKNELIDWISNCHDVAPFDLGTGESPRLRSTFRTPGRPYRDPAVWQDGESCHYGWRLTVHQTEQGWTWEVQDEHGETRDDGCTYTEEMAKELAESRCYWLRYEEDLVECEMLTVAEAVGVLR